MSILVRPGIWRRKPLAPTVTATDLAAAASKPRKPWTVFRPTRAKGKIRRAGVLGGGTRKVAALADRLLPRLSVVE